MRKIPYFYGVVFHDGATATENSAVYPCASPSTGAYTRLNVQVASLGGSSNVEVYGTINGTDWVKLEGQNAAALDDSFVSTISTAGLYIFGITGLTSVRSTYTHNAGSGNVIGNFVGA